MGRQSAEVEFRVHVALLSPFSAEYEPALRIFVPFQPTTSDPKHTHPMKFCREAPGRRSDLEQ
jgi:hypothetical protein